MSTIISGLIVMAGAWYIITNVLGIRAGLGTFLVLAVVVGIAGLGQVMEEQQKEKQELEQLMKLQQQKQQEEQRQQQEQERATAGAGTAGSDTSRGFQLDGYRRRYRAGFEAARTGAALAMPPSAGGRAMGNIIAGIVGLLLLWRFLTEILGMSPGLIVSLIGAFLVIGVIYVVAASKAAREEEMQQERRIQRRQEQAHKEQREFAQRDKQRQLRDQRRQLLRMLEWRRRTLQSKKLQRPADLGQA